MIHDPAKGVPKIPTANSAQTSIKAIKTIELKIIRICKLFTFRITNSIESPVASNKIPITRKSTASHFTSLVNCIAINGRLKSARTITKIITRDLDFILNQLIYIL